MLDKGIKQGKQIRDEIREMTMELEQDYAVGSIIAIEDQLAQKQRELAEAKSHNKFMKADL